ncbi:MAG: argininosuccinate synthase [Bacteroides sp.]|nr:MAG: argininosuccinate synthase [Bacteroides sp.]
MKKIVLAYSGGLDTTYCLFYLKKIKNMDVYPIMIDTYGISTKNIECIKKNLLQLDIKNFKCLNLLNQYYKYFIKYLIYGNVLKNNTYPLSVSAERTIQAIAIAQYTKSINAEYVAHGSTGAGNDQVRFDMIFNILIPNIKIITPIRDNKITREEEIEFLKKYNIHMDFSKSKYSVNKGIWGNSIGGSETLNSYQYLSEEAFQKVTYNNKKRIKISFRKGEICGLNDKFDNPVNIIKYIEEIGTNFGIGRDIHVGDTILGIKGRIGIEIAAPIIIIKSHHALEKHILSKWQLYWKDTLSIWYGNQLHEGNVLDPAMRDIESFFENTQFNVTGDVYISLYPYRFVIEGIKSDYDLMSFQSNVYGEINNSWSSNDIKGFIKIMGMSNYIYHCKNELNDNNYLKKFNDLI